MAQWSDAEIANLTKAVQELRPEVQVTIDDIRSMLTAYSGGTSSSALILNGGTLNFTIMGKTVLLDGKDLTGHLGSRTIVGDVKDSQVTMGDKSPINTTTTHYSLALTVGITLAVTLTVAAAASAIRKRRARANNR